MKKLKPMGELVLVEVDKAKESDLYVPVSSQYDTGKITAVGPDVTNVNKGDRIVFDKNGSINYKDDIFVLESGILAKI